MMHFVAAFKGYSDSQIRPSQLIGLVFRIKSIALSAMSVLRSITPLNDCACTAADRPRKSRMLDCQIGFIGAGQMARALARGFVARQLVATNQLIAFDPEAEALRQYVESLQSGSKSKTQPRTARDNLDVVNQSNVVVLAVKPQSFAAVCRSLERQPTSEKLFISILAGVPLAALRTGLRTDRVIRVMPNTPCLIGQGAAAFASPPTVDEKDTELVTQLFQAVGIVFPLAEHLLDAVTGLSGSGPAYVYMMIEALSDGGVRMGLPRAAATALAAQTVAGAAQMVLTTGDHPGVLKDRVASPAGTTIAGLQVLERCGVRSAIIDAVEAATLRSQELGKQS